MKNEKFLAEYSSEAAVKKYTRATAGSGIAYLLEHEYKAVYLAALHALPDATRRQPLRILEFGCGGGMNLLHLTSMLEHEGFKVETAIGTDFSPVLIEAAQREAKSYLNPDQQEKVRFCAAKNEALLSDLSAELDTSSAELRSSFQFIFGVNTIRYCHRAGEQLNCAKAIFELLVPGGVSVVIDMNNRFPVFRSAIRDRMHKKKEEYYLPSLNEYAAPFAQVGFEILRKEHFSWIPHSAGVGLARFARIASPFLDRCAKSRAMRSLVVVRKPDAAVSQGR